MREEDVPQRHEESRGSAERFAQAVIDAGLKVHRHLGPGLLESIYEQCLSHELQSRGVPHQRQVAIPVTYDGLRLDAAYRIDLLVGNILVVEVKSVGALTGLHQAQLLTYLKLTGHRIGLLINFNVVLFKQGIRRMIL